MKSFSSVKIASIVITVITLCFGFTPAANAEWFDVKIVAVAPKANTGDVAVQIQDVGTSQSLDHFSGVARCWIFNSDTGANKVMASLLTALSLDSVVLLNTDGIPAWNNGLVCKSAGVKAP